MSWCWIRVCMDPNKFQTYEKIDYVEHKTLKLFEKITSLDLIHEKTLNDIIKSPTSSYFDIDEESGIFYRDQQDCYIWYLEKDTGYVYIDGDKKMYVAKSLAEFISHIYTDFMTWYATFMSDE